LSGPSREFSWRLSFPPGHGLVSASGLLSRAAELGVRAVERARKTGEILALVDALRVLGMVLVQQGQLEEAGMVFDEGLALARSLPYPYAEARILVEMGALDEALAIFRRLGAVKDIERIQLEMLGRQ